LLRLILTKGTETIVLIIKSFFIKKRHQKELEDLEKNYGGFTLKKIDTLTGTDFELFVEKIFYELDRDKIIRIDHPGGRGDQGCDLIVRYKNGKVLGIQCKRYAKKVNNKAVQNIVTAKPIHKLTDLMVITNSYFAQSAIEAAMT